MKRTRNYASHKSLAIIMIIVLFIFLMICGYEASGQEIKDYYPAKISLTYANGEVLEDEWEVGYGFDNLNDLVFFNMRPNEDEEFTIIHKIYNISDTFDSRTRLLKSEYFLDDHAALYIRPVYDDPEDALNPTGCYVKLVETIPYSTRRTDIKTIEINFFFYF